MVFHYPTEHFLNLDTWRIAGGYLVDILSSCSRCETSFFAALQVRSRCAVAISSHLERILCASFVHPDGWRTPGACKIKNLAGWLWDTCRMLLIYSNSPLFPFSLPNLNFLPVIVQICPKYISSWVISSFD